MLSLLKNSSSNTARHARSATAHAQRTPIASLSLLGALACAGCGGGGGSNDNNDGGVSTTFAASLSEAQTIPAPVSGTRVRVTITNLAPANGTYQTPVWIGFHDGTFDTYDQNAAADLYFPTDRALEHLAEDGDTEPIQAAFLAQGHGTTQGVAHGVLGPESGPIAPGETVSIDFELDPSDPMNRYMSFASMIIPSNDAFIANGFPTARPIFDGSGTFVANDFVVPGGSARDAGTEVNDEFPASTAFFGQTSPGSGISEAGTVQNHPGFLAPGSGGILDDPMFANADFTAPGYEFLAFHIEVVAAADDAAGVVALGLNGSASSVHVTLGASGLSGGASAVHVHSGAPGATGDVLLDVTDAVTSQAGGALTVDGSFAASSDLVAALRAGTAYVDVHTPLNPLGELRGDVADSGSFTGLLTMAQAVPTPVTGRDVRVTITNAAPDLGTFQTPVWIGFHDGSFDSYDLGSPVTTYFPGTNALESLAEDGDTTLLVGAFTIQAHGTAQTILRGVLGPESGPIAPGETVSRIVRLDPTAAMSGYMTYASMIIPSNDAFTSNDGRMDIPIYTGGSFVATDFVVLGSAALDAGTEVNDEIPANTAFFGQAAPNTGMNQGGSVTPHIGFVAPGGGGILDDPMFANADFTAPGYELLRVRFAESAPQHPAAGLVLARVSLDETQIEFHVFAHDLSGPATAMHFHDGTPGEAGPVLITLTSAIQVNADGRLTAEGTVPVDAGFLEALRAGNVYLNLHTALNPSGEIRGQVVLMD